MPILQVWEQEGIEEEFPVTVSSEHKELLAYPFKWFTVEVYNEGPDEVKIMINKTSLPKAITLDNRMSRTFGSENKPSVWRVEILAESGKTATVRVTTKR